MTNLSHQTINETSTEAQKALRVLTALSFSPMLFLDDDRCVVEANEILLQWLGYSSDDLVGKSIDEFVSPSCCEKLSWSSNDSCFLDPEEVLPFDHIKTKNNKKVHAIGKRSIVDAKGQSFLALTLEPLNKKNESEVVFQDLFFELQRLVPFGFVLVSSNGSIKEVSPKAERILDYGRKDLLEQNIEILLPEHVREEKSELHRCFRELSQSSDGDYRCGELVFRKKTGDHIFADVSIKDIIIGAAPYLVLCISDITLRKQSEYQVTQRGAQLDDMFDLAPNAMIMIDDKGLIQRVNNMCVSLFGFKHDELVGEPVEVLVPEKYRDRHYELKEGYLQRSSSERGMQARKVNILTKAGETKEAEITLSPVEIEGLIFTMASVVDVSDQRRLEREVRSRTEKLDKMVEHLTHSNQQLEQFAFVCSHDLQEPIRMVQSFSQLLASHLKDLDEKSEKYLHFIVDGAERARNMVNDVLTFSRLEKEQLQYEKVPLEELFQRIYRVIYASLEQKGGELSWSAEPPVVVGVATQLEQLFLNLISNGLKFNSSSKPEVCISVVSQGDYWKITVADNGIGISPRYHQKVFEIFQRVNKKSEFPGTGVGLAICQKIVERHHGDIQIESEEGKGTKFHILWPKRSEAENLTCSESRGGKQ
ncbi:PAS domain S-box protein [Pleionea sp. CnH1-48]|nr:PAS domain S-box protein [Pleionea sp. CnH1-48]